MSRRRDPIDDDVPRLPRGRGLKLGTPEVMRIVVTAALLVAIIVMARPCADATSKFVTGFDQAPAGSGQPVIQKPDELPPNSVSLEGLDDEQRRKAIEEARRKAAEQAGQGSGSGSGSSAGSGQR